MARLLENQFSCYELSPREQLEGSTLNISQKMVLMNLRYAYAIEKLYMRVDGTERELIQREAELQGQIRLLDQILQSSEDAQSQLLSLAQNNSDR